MPIYEYRCNNCRKRTSVFIRSMSATVEAACSHCGAGDLTRLFSRVAVLRSEEAALDGFAEGSMGDVDESDPRSMARWLRRMSHDMGEPIDSEMEAELDRMEAGEMPEEMGDDEDAFEDSFVEGM